MAAPTVQSVEQIISDLNPAYQGGIDVINQRRSQLPAMFESQRMGLNAEKVQGFNQINTQANARGMAFSGIPLDEQANYLSTKYLPGLQQLKYQENEQNLALDESLAKINQERRLRAMDTRQTQQASLESYLAEEREREWQRQKFEAEQAMERTRLSQQLSIANADRAASSARTAAAAPPTLTKNGSGGWVVSGGGDLAGYARATGTDLITLLSQGDKQDQQAAKWYRDNIKLGRGEAYAMDRLMNYDRPTAFYRGG